jgi:hypothetical protein
MNLTRITIHAACLTLALALGGCDDGAGAAGSAASSAAAKATGASTAAATSKPTATAVTTAATAAPTSSAAAAPTSSAAAAPAGDLSTPRGSIEYQVGLIKEGKVDELKACFTDRQKGNVTPGTVAMGQKQLAKLTIEEMIGKIEESEVGGKKTAKIRMKGGNILLTTLILTDGKWLADTIWYK